jgi:hypothetical protein
MNRIGRRRGGPPVVARLVLTAVDFWIVVTLSWLFSKARFQ